MLRVQFLEVLECSAHLSAEPDVMPPDPSSRQGYLVALLCWETARRRGHRLSAGCAHCSPLCRTHRTVSLGRQAALQQLGQGVHQRCARAETVSSQPGAPLLQSTLSPVALQVPVSQSAQQLQAVAQQPVSVRQAPATGTRAVVLVQYRNCAPAVSAGTACACGARVGSYALETAS